MQLAALDLGSSSFHLVVVQTVGTSELVKLHSQKEVLRLGAVVQERGQLSDAAFAAALCSVERLAQAAREHGADKLFTVATSALREARNGQAFCDACREQLGVSVELLSGDEEARLAYLGARSGVASTTARVLVVDVAARSSWPWVRVTTARRCRPCGSGSCAWRRLSRGLRQVQASGSPATCSSSARRRAGSSGASTPCCFSGGTARDFGQPEVRVSTRGVREGVLLRELSRRAATRAA
jgi:exopolyphosphatase/pppGpp-phosphohydrolase